MKKKLGLITSMIKIGMIGFGGGNALIPVIQQEVVEEKKYITKEEYEKDIIAATLTPGALPVEIASGVGKAMCGMPGMIAGGLLMALPGAIMTVLLLAGVNMVSAGVLQQIRYASIGITAFIMCLLTEYIRGTFSVYRGRNAFWKALAICLVVFALTAGNNIYRIFQIDGTPIFGISTIDMLVIAFFGILVSECKFTWQNLVPTGIVVGVYLLCIGDAKIIDNLAVTWVVRGVMIVLSVYSLNKSNQKRKKKPKTVMGPLVKETLIWILFIGVCSIPAILVIGGDTLMFAMKGIFSSLISFGGGDAYLTIADGLFVPHYISEKDYYNSLVLIVNVLPGSILCKTLTGVGFSYGLGHAGGSMIAGSVMAVCGFACSVAASCGVFGVIYYLYEYLENIDIFVNVKKSIKVIVSGMLMTVMSGLIQSNMSVGNNTTYPWYTILVMVFVIYGLNVFLYRKAKCKNIVLIGMSLVLSLGVCNAMGI